MVKILNAVLDQTIDCREWGNFLDIPMKGTPELEAIRLACETLYEEESMDENDVIVFTKKGREKLKSLLRSLDK